MSAAQPRCPRCGLPLDPLASAPSADGPVHVDCVRDENLVAQARPSDDALPRMQPMYGGPRPNVSGDSRVISIVLALVAAAIALGLVLWLVRR